MGWHTVGPCPRHGRPIDLFHEAVRKLLGLFCWLDATKKGEKCYFFEGIPRSGYLNTPVVCAETVELPNECVPAKMMISVRPAPIPESKTNKNDRVLVSAVAHLTTVNALLKEVLTVNQTIHLRVMSPLLAVDATADYVTIPETATIETTDDLGEPGFHRVRYLGESLLVFTRDIQERTQRVSRASIM